MSEKIKAPAPSPCGSCPYRIDTPAGVWSEEEYDKLPDYDNETSFQPGSVFMCHQQDGKLCAGWVGCHDMENNLGLRMALALDMIDSETADQVCDYTTDVPLHPSGTAAADFGKSEIEIPGEKAKRVVAKLQRKLDND